jgi:hypothetical protein
MLFWSIYGGGNVSSQTPCPMLFWSMPYAVLEHALCCFGACPMLFWCIPQLGMVDSSVGDGGFLSQGWCIPQLGMLDSSVEDAGFLHFMIYGMSSVRGSPISTSVSGTGT